MEFCIYCNKADFMHHQWPCDHCKQIPAHHKTTECKRFVIEIDEEWGMARRSDEWQEAELALRKVICKEYGHIFFPGSPYTWKTYCGRCFTNQGEGNG